MNIKPKNIKKRLLKGIFISILNIVALAIFAPLFQTSLFAVAKQYNVMLFIMVVVTPLLITLFFDNDNDNSSNNN